MNMPMIVKSLGILGSKLGVRVKWGGMVRNYLLIKQYTVVLV